MTDMQKDRHDAENPEQGDLNLVRQQKAEQREYKRREKRGKKGQKIALQGIK